VRTVSILDELFQVIRDASVDVLALIKFDWTIFIYPKRHVFFNDDNRQRREIFFFFSLSLRENLSSVRYLAISEGALK
jgi:hypothetical protein